MSVVFDYIGLRPSEKENWLRNKVHDQKSENSSDKPAGTPRDSTSNITQTSRSPTQGAKHTVFFQSQTMPSELVTTIYGGFHK